MTEDEYIKKALKKLEMDLPNSNRASRLTTLAIRYEELGDLEAADKVVSEIEELLIPATSLENFELIHIITIARRIGDSKVAEQAIYLLEENYKRETIAPEQYIVHLWNARLLFLKKDFPGASTEMDLTFKLSGSPRNQTTSGHFTHMNRILEGIMANSPKDITEAIVKARRDIKKYNAPLANDVTVVYCIIGEEWLERNQSTVN